MRKLANRTGERGSVGVMVAIGLVVLVTLAAAAIDIGKAIYVRSSLQSALDVSMTAAAAAALSLPSTLTDQQITDESRTIAQNIMISNFKLSSDVVTFDPSSTTDFSIVFTTPNLAAPNVANENTLLGTVNATIPMSFAKIFGLANLPITITTRVQRPRPAPVEMAIVADVSQSMNEPFGTATKIDALRTSAQTLVDTLMTGAHVRIGLLPVAGFVRLENYSNYYNSTANPLTSKVNWLRMLPDPNLQSCVPKVPCVLVPSTCYSDGVPYSCSICDCTMVRRAYYWDGCVAFRPVPERTTISNPTATPYYSVVSSLGCAQTPFITDLVEKNGTYVSGGISYSGQALLTARISALRVAANGWGTYLPSGLIWAWNMLTAETTAGGALDNNFPLNSGYTAAEITSLGVRRAIVLITDGTNTLYAVPPTVSTTTYDTYGNIASSTNPTQNLRQTTVDMTTICNNIRAADINIFVIALQFTPADLSFKTLLRDNCAGAANGPAAGTAAISGAQFFFDVSSPAQLQAAFDRIGGSFANNIITQ